MFLSYNVSSIHHEGGLFSKALVLEPAPVVEDWAQGGEEDVVAPAGFVSAVAPAGRPANAVKVWNVLCVGLPLQSITCL